MKLTDIPVINCGACCATDEAAMERRFAEYSLMQRRLAESSVLEAYGMLIALHIKRTQTKPERITLCVSPALALPAAAIFAAPLTTDLQLLLAAKTMGEIAICADIDDQPPNLRWLLQADADISVLSMGCIPSLPEVTL
jgi:hypothetical protein